MQRDEPSGNAATCPQCGGTDMVDLTTLTDIAIRKGCFSCLKALLPAKQPAAAPSPEMQRERLPNALAGACKPPAQLNALTVVSVLYPSREVRVSSQGPEAERWLALLSGTDSELYARAAAVYLQALRRGDGCAA